jgi:hypothetical protein
MKTGPRHIDRQRPAPRHPQPAPLPHAPRAAPWPPHPHPPDHACRQEKPPGPNGWTDAVRTVSSTVGCSRSTRAAARRPGWEDGRRNAAHAAARAPTARPPQSAGAAPRRLPGQRHRRQMGIHPTRGAWRGSKQGRRPGGSAVPPWGPARVRKRQWTWRAVQSGAGKRSTQTRVRAGIKKPPQRTVAAFPESLPGHRSGVHVRAYAAASSLVDALGQLFLDASRLAAALTQVVQLGTAHITATLDFDLGDQGE